MTNGPAAPRHDPHHQPSSPSDRGPPPPERSEWNECRAMLELVRERCPGLVPPDPLDAGTLAPEVTVSVHTAQDLFAVAALNAAGLLGPSGRPTAEAVVWTDNDCELLV